MKGVLNAAANGGGCSLELCLVVQGLGRGMPPRAHIDHLLLAHRHILVTINGKIFEGYCETKGDREEEKS